MVDEIRNCPTHGDTTFRYYEKKGRSGLWKCLMCESERAVINKQKYKLEAVLSKGGCCLVCGYNKNLSALEFHHIDPTLKDFGISTTRHSRELTLKELDKCILLCSNCHREIHNPNSNIPYLTNLIKLHEDKALSKLKPKEYPYTLEELESKRLQLGTWKQVALFYNISLATLKRHRNKLQMDEKLL